MEATEGSPSQLIKNASLQGKVSYPIAKLERFDKKRHSLPEEANEYTNAFLARLIEDELEELAEGYFKNFRTALNYKRKDLTLSVGAPSALFEGRDFKFEITYEVDDDSPEFYNISYKLYQITDEELIHNEAFNEALGGTFDSVSFECSKLLSITSIIDSIEEEDGPMLSVEYPSSCTHCEITVEGHEALIHCQGATLAVEFSHSQSPREIQSSFSELQSAFNHIIDLTLWLED